MGLQIVGRFVLQIFVGAVLFTAVALVAAGLWLLAQWLKNIGLPYHIWFVAEAITDLLFYLDVLCFIVFVVGEAIKLIREIYWDVFGRPS